AAVAQLRRQAGRTVIFRTGLLVLAPGTHAQSAVINVEARFRDLSREEIEHYVASEDVTATAGSIKSEGLGITLVEAIRSDDPTALIGLPLIALRGMLAKAGLPLPGDA
ncbi:MAG: Maf family protein, partial [Sinobacteraceae bacterium]|nr:Maf family protein [Nevskiaceae bacterium]